MPDGKIWVALVIQVDLMGLHFERGKGMIQSERTAPSTSKALNKPQIRHFCVDKMAMQCEIGGGPNI